MMEAVLEKRNTAHKAMMDLLQTAATEKRSLGGEEDEQYLRMEKDFDQAQAELRRIEAMEQRAANMVATQKTVAQEVSNETEKRDRAINATAEYRESFEAFMRGKGEVRGLVVNTDSKGGYLAPVEFENVLIKKLEELNVMRQICDVRNMGAKETNIPVAANQGAASWLDEEEAYPDTDDTYGQKVLKAKKVGRIIKISEELLADAAFNMEAELSISLAEAIAKAEENSFINGTTAKEPTGLLSQVGTTITSTVAGALAYDDLVELRFAITSPYRREAVYLMADSAAKVLMKLKDGDGRPLWQPSIQAGQPDLVLGQAVYYSPYMPTFGTGAKTIAYGNFKYYRIADRVGLFVQRLNELYAATGQIGFRGHRRTDGNLLVPDAIAALAIG